MNAWIIVIWLTTGQFIYVPLEVQMTSGDCMKAAHHLVAPHRDKVAVYGCVINSGKET